MNDAPKLWQRVGASALTGLTFIVVYNGCNYLTSLKSNVGSCYFWWERYYPFVPILIIPYWSLDAFFTAAPFFIRKRYALRQHVLRIVCTILTAGFFFLNFPLQMAWTRPPVEGFLGKLFGSLNNFHNFYNCAPSLHIALRSLLWPIYVTPLLGLPRFVLGVWFVAIGVSTLLCWQHYMVDVITGQLNGLFFMHVFPLESPPRPRVDVRHRINSDLRIARRYATVTVVLLALTALGWPGTVLLLWPVVALAILAVAYAGGGPAWLNKRRGVFPHGSYGLLAPYRWIAEHTFRHFSRTLPASVSLGDGVAFGRRWSGDWTGDEPASVLDLTAEYEEHPAWREKAYLNVPVLDLTSPSVEQLQEAVAFIHDAPRPVYIHCSLGLGRSCAVAAAWLLALGRVANEAEAVRTVRELQPRVALAPGTERVLAEYAHTLLG